MNHLRIKIKSTTGCAMLCVMMSVLGCNSTRAQDMTGNDVLRNLESNFVTLDSLILGQPKATARHMAESPARQEGEKTITDEMDAALKRRTDAEIKEKLSETGLQISGQAYYRLDDDLGLDEDDEVSLYRAKAQVELSWDFLKSSLRNRQGRKNEVELQEQIDRKRYMREDLGLLVAKQKDIFSACYDKALSSVLVHHINNLSLLSDAYEFLLKNENISSDDLMSLLNEKAETERLYASACDGECEGADDLSSPAGVVVLIDTTALYDKIRQTQYDMDVLSLQMQKLDQQAANTSYWNQLTLSPFVRYSYYFRKDIDNSSNLDVGLSFRIPLNASTARKRRALQAQKDLLEVERRHTEERVLEAVRLIVTDIAKMNRSTKGELQRLKDQKDYIRMRQTAYNNRKGDYNVLARAKEYNKYFECWEKLLAFQYQRDCLISDLQTFLTDTSVLEYCHEVEL